MKSGFQSQLLTSKIRFLVSVRGKDDFSGSHL